MSNDKKTEKSKEKNDRDERVEKEEKDIEMNETSEDYTDTYSGDSKTSESEIFIDAFDAYPAWNDSSENYEKPFEIEFQGEVTKRFKKEEVEKIDLKQSVFTARCRIKLFKIYGDIFIAVDAFNMIYLFKNSMKKDKTYRIKFFKISDFIRIDDYVYFVSEISAFMYRLDINTEKIECIKKNYKNIRKVVEMNRKILCLSDKLVLLDENVSKVNEFVGDFTGITSFRDNFYALKETGEIYLFDEELKFKEEIVLEDKFTFKSIFSTENNIIIGTTMGIILLDGENKIAKEIRTLKKQVEIFAYTNKYICYAGKEKHSFRIIKNDETYEPFENFPYRSVFLVEHMAAKDDNIYIAIGKNILEFNVKSE